MRNEWMAWKRDRPQFRTGGWTDSMKLDGYCFASFEEAKDFAVKLNEDRIISLKEELKEELERRKHILEFVSALTEAKTIYDR